MGWLGLIGRTWTKGLPACVGDCGNDRSLFSLNHLVTMQRPITYYLMLRIITIIGVLKPITYNL